MRKNIVTHLLSVLAVAGILNAYDGVNIHMGHKETYYNKPMKKIVQTAKEKGIPGEYWENDQGLKMYGSYIIVAADYAVHPYGSLVSTSHGTAIVLDTGSFKYSSPDLIDVATTW